MATVSVTGSLASSQAVLSAVKTRSSMRKVDLAIYIMAVTSVIETIVTLVEKLL